MKRALVAYSSDADDSTDERGGDGDGGVEQPPAKRPCVDAARKKLPGLPPTIYAHVDDPAKHQGRVRTRRHVDGLYAAYVHLAIPLQGVPQLAQFVASVTRFARTSLPALHSDWASEVDGDLDHEGAAELHVSLSRPIYLSANQRDVLRSAVRAIARKHRHLSISFANFTVFENDERTRTFLALEVGAGFDQLRDIVSDVDEELRRIRQQPFYPDPRFHASIAWAVLKTDANSPSDSTIPKFPPSLLSNIEETFGQELPKLGPFIIDNISLRIGKVSESWLLSG